MYIIIKEKIGEKIWKNFWGKKIWKENICEVKNLGIKNDIYLMQLGFHPVAVVGRLVRK
jgi:hypothetical protein